MISSVGNFEQSNKIAHVFYLQRTCEIPNHVHDIKEMH